MYPDQLLSLSRWHSGCLEFWSSTFAFLRTIDGFVYLNSPGEVVRRIFQNRFYIKTKDQVYSIKYRTMNIVSPTEISAFPSNSVFHLSKIFFYYR